MNALLSITRTKQKSMRGCVPLTNEEREIAWRERAKASGVHYDRVPRRKLWRHEKPRIRIVND